MKNYLYLFITTFCIIVTGCITDKSNKSNSQTIDISTLPHDIYQERGAFHVQGVAVDIVRGYAYFSFTTSLVKTDLQGNLIGSVEGMMGHLGCIDINPDDGRIYGSLEYKDDAIGQGIRNTLNKNDNNTDNAFYIAIFDVDKITRPDMSAEQDGVLTTVYLKNVADDYTATVRNAGKDVKHRYGCSGIDGVSFGPQFGSKDGKNYLCVAYGIYGDTTRTDNDYQVLLQYDVTDWNKYEQPLSQYNIHRSGPNKPLNKYFVFTGNTDWGIQNLEYDKDSGYWFAAVYNGHKSQYPNYSLFAINGSKAPQTQSLKGFENGEKGKVLSLAKEGLYDVQNDIYGWNFKLGSTGFHAIGNGYFYISQNEKTEDGKQFCRLQLYRRTSDDDNKPFKRIE